MKSNYLINQEFMLYQSGVYTAMVKFTNKEVEVSMVDPKTRFQRKRNKFSNITLKNSIKLDELYKELVNYSAEEWKEDIVTLKNKKKYNKYLTYTGEVNGEKITSQLWANRKARRQYIDVITVNNEVIAFIAPGRLTMEILVKKGYENVTPLTKYTEELLSKPEYGFNSLGNQWVTMRDGVNLATDVYLPYGTKQNQKFPTIVIRTCYGKDETIYRCSHWVNRGYAVVVQDVRGRSDSDGELYVFNYERDDASDLFDWIVTQDWSNGQIGMWGASYLGYTTTAAATSGNPHLKTAISEVNVGSPFVDTARRNGTICSWPLLSWTLAQSVGNRVSRDIFMGKELNVEEICKMRPITSIPEKIINCKSGPWDRWAQHYYFDEYWQDSDQTENGHNIKIPMLIMSGWYDGDAAGVQETWRILTQHDVKGRRIVLGPWPHGLNGFRDAHDREFGNNAIDYDFDTRILRWFDKYLKGIENGEDKKPRAIYYVGGENTWRTSNEWNPVETTLTNFYLASEGNANSLFGNGKLVASLQDIEGSDSYVYDPENPIGIKYDDKEGYKKAQSRSDILVYETDVLKEDIAVAGDFFAEFYASSSAVDTDFNVRVTDVDESGNVIKISDYCIRAEFRKGKKNPELLTPGKVEKYELNMLFNGHVFKKGHKIRVDITSSNFYMYFANTNTGVNPYLDPDPIIATNTIYHGKKYPSCVKLPILYGKL